MFREFCAWLVINYYPSWADAQDVVITVGSSEEEKKDKEDITWSGGTVRDGRCTTDFSSRRLHKHSSPRREHEEKEKNYDRDLIVSFSVTCSFTKNWQTFLLAHSVSDTRCKFRNLKSNFHKVSATHTMIIKFVITTDQTQIFNMQNLMIFQVLKIFPGFI